LGINFDWGLAQNWDAGSAKSGLDPGFLLRKPSSAWRTPHAARIAEIRKAWSALLECHLGHVKRASCLLANMTGGKCQGMKNLRGGRGLKKHDGREIPL
jgi:hypothetical protein